MYLMYVIPHISNRILDFFWELPAYSIQPMTKVVLLKGIWYVSEEQPWLSIE